MSFVALTDFALTGEHIIAWQWAAGDPHIINAAEFAYDWDLAEARGAFGTRQVYTADASVSRYGRRPALQIESRGLKTDSGAQTMLDERAYEVMRRFSEPPPVLVVEVFYSRHLLEPGDQVRVTHPWIPNLRTGLRGLTQETFEVLDMTPQFAGSIRLTLLWVYALATVATPTSGGSLTQPRIRPDEATYRLAGTAQAFIGTGVLPAGVALVKDDASGKVHYVTVNSFDGDVYWGAAYPTLDEQAALGLVTTGSWFFAGAALDGTNLQVGLSTTVLDLQYLKLSPAGAILSGPTAKWTGTYRQPALLVGGSTVYWIIPGTNDIYLATTDLAGAEITAPASVYHHATDAYSGTLAACWSSAGAILVFAAKNVGETDYLRIDTAGTLEQVRRGAVTFPSGYQSSVWNMLGCFVAAKFLYLVAATTENVSSGSATALLGRFTQSGHAADGMRLLETAPGAANGAMYDATTDTLYVARTRYVNPTYDAWLSRFTRSGG